MYSNVSEKEVLLHLFGLIEVETNFVNYLTLDDGKSFGVFSMRWTTAENVAEQREEGFNEYKLTHYEEKQIKYGVYHFYKLLQRTQCLDKAIISYNQGSVDVDEYFHNYLFLVRGRVDYLKERWELE